MSWQVYENDWPHVHFALVKDNEIWISGKEGLLKRLK